MLGFAGGTNLDKESPMPLSPDLTARLAKLRLVSFDVDGVMTDGGLYLGSGGAELKRFNVRDGAGIVYLQRAGIKTVVITGRESEAVAARCRELNIEECHQGVKKKWATLRGILEKHGIQPEEAAHVGDDLLDLALLGNVGVFLTVADAVAEVRVRADHVASLGGGKGAVRELSETILRAQGKWDGVIETYLRKASEE